MSDTKDENPQLTQADRLAQMLMEFTPDEIRQLPRQPWTDAWPKGTKRGKCKICNGYHPLDPPALHLSYLGHAPLTRRLLQVDPLWTWEPLAYGPDGLPMLDRNGGLWIKLTVCGVTRLGYGDAPGKQGGAAVKELIGDALRNAAMRFGAALGLWHNGEQFAFENDDGDSDKKDDSPPVTTGGEPNPLTQTKSEAGKFADKVLDEIKKCANMAEIDAVTAKNGNGLARLKEVAGPRWIEISDAISARADELRFPAGDREPGSDG